MSIANRRAIMVEKRWLFASGNPATEWEPISFYNDKHDHAIVGKRYTDPVGHRLGVGRKVTLYELRAAVYRRTPEDPMSKSQF